MLKHESNSSLWFLPTYFISVVIFDLYQKMNNKCKNKRIALAMDLISLILLFEVGYIIPYTNYGIIWGLDVALIGFALMIIGKNIRIIINSFKTENKYNIIYIVILIIAIYMYKFNGIDDYILLAEKRIGNPVIFMIVSICGFSLVYFLSKEIERINKNKIKKALIYIGDNTLVFLVLQKIVIAIFNKLLSVINAFHQPVSSILIIIFSVIVLSILAFLINKYIPELNGKKRRL